MNGLYLDSGWVNAERLTASNAPFVIAVGGRGIGKTYGVIKDLLIKNEKFIYLRRTQTQIEACKIDALSPFKPICDDLGIIVKSKPISKYVAGFFKVNDKEELFSVGVSLTAFASIRGFSAQDYDYLLFDEFIPERHERRMTHEGEAFLNLLESINRNRELQDKPPLKVIMLSNANKLDSPILQAIGALKPLDKMIRKGVEYSSFFDGDLEIYRYLNSPISERKKNTALYRIANNRDFENMSVNNSFGDEIYENVKSMPLREFIPLVSIKEMTIYSHKADKIYYVIPGVKCENVISNDVNFLKGFRRKYFYLYTALCSGKVFFSDADIKIKFSNIWEI